MPFTARLNVFCGGAITKFDFSDELLFAFDDEDFAEDEDFASLEEDSCFAEELLGTTLDELCFSEELEGGATELLLDSSLLLRMTSEEELLAGICDELDSVAELLDTTGAELEDDSAPELLDCELLDSPYLE
ncbi:hypothetical protein B7988_04990 [Fibrobacter sp. UWB1]|nr:hypothetical protein B7988_04990 [Fibrobacter sp. UWB1]